MLKSGSVRTRLRAQSQEGGSGNDTPGGLKPLTMGVRVPHAARVTKLVDVQDLKSCDPKDRTSSNLVTGTTRSVVTYLDAGSKHGLRLEASWEYGISPLRFWKVMQPQWSGD